MKKPTSLGNILSKKVEDIEEAVAELYAEVLNLPKPKDGKDGVNGKDGNSIKGEKGDKGKDGINGRDGVDGRDGIDGIDGVSIKGDKGEKGGDGKSAYEIWLEEGNAGTQEEFLESLKGRDGESIHTYTSGGATPMLHAGDVGRLKDATTIQSTDTLPIYSGGKIYKAAATLFNSLYVPYTGATQPVDLGAFGLVANDLTVGSLEGILKAGSGVVSGNSAINDLSDITESSPTDAQVLKYDGVNLDYRNGFVAESEVTFTDITTNNSSTSKHGYLPKLSGSSTQYLDGTGAYSIPSGVVNSYTSQAFSAQTSVTVTHNFGVYPVVQVLDGSGFLEVPLDVEHTSVNAFTVTFTSSSSGTIIASVGSAGLPNVTTTATNYTTTATDKYIRATASGITITLVASPSIGLEQEVKNDASGSITVASSDNIDGDATAIVSPSDNLAMYYNGTEWTIR